MKPRGPATHVVLLILVGAAVFLGGLNWGLPSRAADPFLFGGHPVWTGAEIQALLPAEGDADRGADVDANPLRDRSKPLLLNATDAQRAEIVRRYRLFSYQPDEMITFMALSRMRPGALDFDPRLYQYGGLWIYPVGVMLKVGAAIGAVDVRGDKVFYLDHPEQFGRFYVVARLYTALWAMVGVGVVYRMARRISVEPVVHLTAGLAYILLPVVVYASHEAKPHLPGAVLSLAAVLAAMRYVENGRVRDAVVAGALCGAAWGMVVSAVVMLGLIPTMVMLCAGVPVRRRGVTGVWALVAACTVYAVTNPYVPINALFRPGRLTSNLGNSVAMYRPGYTESLVNAAKLVAEGTSAAIAIVGTVGVLAIAIRLRRDAAMRERWLKPAVLLAVPAALAAVPFALLAGGKPAEHGRFAILPDIALMLAAVAAVQMFVVEAGRRRTAFVLIVLGAGIPGMIYWGGYVADCRAETTRVRAAGELKQAMEAADRRALALYAEPAPYSVPPVNLFDWELVLLPRGSAMEAAGVSLRAVDHPSAGSWPRKGSPPYWLPSPMSWASKRFEVRGTPSEPVSPSSPRR